MCCSHWDAMETSSWRWFLIRFAEIWFHVICDCWHYKRAMQFQSGWADLIFLGSVSAAIVSSWSSKAEVLAKCDWCAGFWSVCTCETKRRWKVKAGRSNSRISFKSHSPACTRCSERLTKIGKGRGESVWHYRCGTPDELLLWQCKIQKKKKLNITADTVSAAGATEQWRVFGRWQQGYGFFFSPLSFLSNVHFKDGMTPRGWLC